jgi:hypothetical protein
MRVTGMQLVHIVVYLIQKSLEISAHVSHTHLKQGAELRRDSSVEVSEGLETLVHVHETPPA